MWKGDRGGGEGREGGLTLDEADRVLARTDMLGISTSSVSVDRQILVAIMLPYSHGGDLGEEHGGLSVSLLTSACSATMKQHLKA